MLCLVKVQQCSVHNKCPFTIFTSTQSLPIPSAQRSPSGIIMYLKASKRSGFLDPCSMREARLRLVLSVPICCASPCFALEPRHVYLHPNVRVIVSPIAKLQYFYWPMTVFLRVRGLEIANSLCERVLHESLNQTQLAG